MKLLFCPHCHDVQKLIMEKRTCRCGKSWGLYMDNLNATIGGSAIPLGVLNGSFQDALAARPHDGNGSCFTAFVIPHQCPTVVDEGDGDSFKFLNAEEREVLRLALHAQCSTSRKPAN